MTSFSLQPIAFEKKFSAEKNSFIKNFFAKSLFANSSNYSFILRLILRLDMPMEEVFF